MEHDIKFYCMISILAVLSIASILTLNAALILISLIITAFAVALYRLHYIVDAMIFKRSNLVQIVDSYELSGERTTAMRRYSSTYCATAAALLEINSSGRIEREQIEGIVGNSRCPFRFIMQIEGVDINKLLDKLDTRRGMHEIELNRLISADEKSNSLRINRLKRQIEYIRGEMEKLNSGGAPLRLSQYIMTSAVSDNRLVSQERAKSQIRELASEFGALTGSKAVILSGNDLLDLLKFDSGALQ